MGSDNNISSYFGPVYVHMIITYLYCEPEVLDARIRLQITSPSVRRKQPVGEKMALLTVAYLNPAFSKFL